MNWIGQAAVFANRMTLRFMEKQSEGCSGYLKVSELEYRKRAIVNILDGDYVDAANLCLLADLVRGAQEVKG